MGQKTAAGMLRRPAFRRGFLVGALTLVIALVLATGVGAIPPLGHTFYGTVKNSGGTSLPNGTQIMAKTASGPWTGTVTTKVGPPDAANGQYFLTVPGDDPGTSAVEGAVAGNPVVLYVGGAKAKMIDAATGKAVDSFAWASGAATQINLQIDVNYTITASATGGGSISPAGSVSVPLGSNKTFNMTADASYALSDVIVDGASVGPVNPYTFNNVSANHTIQAVFRSTLGSIAGFVFIDSNGNGAREEGETSGVEGVTITLTLPGGGTQTVVSAGADGSYTFGSLQPGQYTVTQTQPVGYNSTSPAALQVTVTAGNPSVANFGQQQHTPTPSPTLTPSPTPTVTETPTPSPTPETRKVYLPLVTQ